ncbi:hypothetical protein [Croceicoccus marinus]|jgi:hypothetical protein|uniref:Uncharacterized protein n=1 Tax=Croceicoccus marinus TaxID=450378 RepID=A0A7G6VQB8_9SPHN|nr:hypothetical protein [Croceicoccus marinus]QNE03933.1 hypothetical protein H4O24_07785 [Croceicoccus marinus]
MRSRLIAMIGSCASVALAGCGSGNSETPGEEVATDEAPAFPAELVRVGDGYPESGDPCVLVGESEATVDFLDDSADLVACPTRDDAAVLGGRNVGVIDSYHLVSVPRSSPMGEAVPVEMLVKEAVAPKLGDPIRSPSGMETRCLARVNELTGGNVIGSRRIEEAESGVMIYVNVQGAEAPWQCFGSKDGTISEVYYGGNEGAL